MLATTGPSRQASSAAHLHRMDITRITDTDTGTRTVHTRNSVFTIDLDARSVTRAGVVPLLASGQETFHLVRVVDAVVGHPMILDVLVGGVRLPMATSAVASIAVAQPAAAARKGTV